jgi:sugar lactone lactonase YvrE
MKNLQIVGVIGGIGAAAMLTACSAAGRQSVIGVPAATGDSVYTRTTSVAGPLSPDAGRVPLLYVSVQNSPSRILVYRQDEKNQSPVRTISNGLVAASGITVTPDGDLWVADPFIPGVHVFKRGASTEFKTLSDPGQYPVDVAVDENGTAYVFNSVTADGGPGSVSVYPKGHTLPTDTLAVPGNQNVTTGAVDSAGNLYVGFFSGLTGDIDEFIGGGGTAIDLHATGLTRPTGITFDNTGDALVADLENVEVYVFDLPGQTPESHFLAGDPVTSSFNSDFKHVYILNAAGSVLELTYPGLKQINRISKGFHEHDFQYDIATDPPARPR